MDWLELVIGIGAVAAFLTFGIAGAVTVMVGRMARRGIVLTPAREADHPRDFAAAAEVDAWARSQKFEPAGYYIAELLSPSFIAAWQHRDRPTYLCMYGVQNSYVYEFVTVFANDRILTTANTPDAQLLPRPPGYYLQSFNKVPLDELLTRHATAELCLIQHGRLQEEPLTENFESYVTRAMARQMAYVRSIPLWQLRGGYWFLFRKDRFHGKSIEALHGLNKAPFPHDAAFREFSR